AAKMFDVAQLVHGAVVSQTISDATARLAASDQAVGAAIRELQDARRHRDGLLFSFNSLAARATSSGDQKVLNGMRDEIKRLETRIGELEPQVQSAAPNFNVLRDQAATFAEVGPLIRDDEALLQVLVTPAHSFVFFAHAGSIKVARADVTSGDLAADVGKLKTAFFVRAQKIKRFDVTLAHQLYTWLVGPFESDLQGVNRLVIVPSGPLLGLPLGVLVTKPTPPVSGRDYTAVPFLPEQASLTTAPSTRAFVDLRRRAGSAAAQPFLGMGDFKPSGDPEPLLKSRGLPESCRPSALAVANAPRLPGTADQIRAMARALAAGD